MDVDDVREEEERAQRGQAIALSFRFSGRASFRKLWFMMKLQKFFVEKEGISTSSFLLYKTFLRSARCKMQPSRYIEVD